MPRHCYYKPNRKTRRVFTERDAARVLCSAFENGATVKGFFESVEGCAPDALVEYIKDEVEKRIKPQLCEVATDIDFKIRSRILKIISPLRRVGLFVDGLDNAVTKLEEFTILGRKVIPERLTSPFRTIVDRINELLDDIDAEVLEITGQLDILKEYCNGDEI